MLHYLNLPKLPDSCVSNINRYATEYWKNWIPSSNAPFIESYKENTNFVYRIIDFEFDDPETRYFIKDAIGLETDLMLFFMENRGSGPAWFPPHRDHYRKTGLNYLISAGGDDVQTVTFKPTTDPRLAERKLFLEKEIVEDSRSVIPEHSWVCFNAQNPHMVTNITSRRLILLVNPESQGNMNFEDFINQFKSFLIDKS